MLLSRFWYVILSVFLAAAVFMTLLATRMFDRASTRTMGESLAGDSQVVGSYLRDDARKRSIALMVAAFDEEIRTNLAKSSAAADKGEKVPADAREKVKSALRKQFTAIAPDQRFDAMFAVDQSGRVVAQMGFEDASGNETFELGGYPVVADALHGWVRDDSWVLGSRIFRIVARPVEHDLSALPAGAIVGARVIDDSFARELSRRTGAAIGFYAHGARVSSGAPEGFDVGLLDTISVDLRGVEGDPIYKERGVSDVRMVSDTLGVVYARVVGEAWDLGAGYAVARTAHVLGSPMGFLRQFDDKDKKSVALWIPMLVALLGSAIGLGLSVLEHSMPLRTFGREAQRFAKGENDQLVPSRFRGAYRTIATWINDGTDKVAAKGGAPRKAADLEQVLGPMPSKPAMSAFSLPQDGAAVLPAVAPVAPPFAPAPVVAPAPAAPVPAAPAPAAPAPVPAGSASAPPTVPIMVAAAPVAPAQDPSTSGTVGGPPPPPRAKAPMPPPAPPPRPFGFGNPPPSPPTVAKAPAAPVVAPGGADLPRVPSVGDEDDEATVVSHVPSEIMAQFGRDTTRPPAAMEDLAAWQETFGDYLRVRRECGEPVDGITFEKFKKTLQRNRDQLVQQHGCKDVKFSVYVKDGRAAIKANPIR